MRSTLEEYLLWMSKSGNKRKVGGERLPAEPLSPRTSLRHLKKTRTVLRDLGYLIYIKNPIPRRPNQWLVNPEKDVRFLSVEEIESWFQSHIPSGDRTPPRDGPMERLRWGHPEVRRVHALWEGRVVRGEAREDQAPDSPFRRRVPGARDCRAREGPRLPAVARSPARVLRPRD